MWFKPILVGDLPPARSGWESHISFFLNLISFLNLNLLERHTGLIVFNISANYRICSSNIARHSATVINGTLVIFGSLTEIFLLKSFCYFYYFFLYIPQNKHIYEHIRFICHCYIYKAIWCIVMLLSNLWPMTYNSLFRVVFIFCLLTPYGFQRPKKPSQVLCYCLPVFSLSQCVTEAAIWQPNKFRRVGCTSVLQWCLPTRFNTDGGH